MVHQEVYLNEKIRHWGIWREVEVVYCSLKKTSNETRRYHMRKADCPLDWCPKSARRQFSLIWALAFGFRRWLTVSSEVIELDDWLVIKNQNTIFLLYSKNLKQSKYSICCWAYILFVDKSTGEPNDNQRLFTGYRLLAEGDVWSLVKCLHSS